MSTRTKNSTDSTHKLNRRSIFLKVTIALIVLLTVFPGAQRVASTQGPAQRPS